MSIVTLVRVRRGCLARTSRAGLVTVERSERPDEGKACEEWALRERQRPPGV
jgi:hypothetical protein